MHLQRAPRHLLFVLIASLVFIVHIVLLTYEYAVYVSPLQAARTHSLAATPTSIPHPTPSPMPTPKLAIALTPKPPEKVVLPVVKDTRKILGVEGDPSTSFPRISWVRIGYASCGEGKPQGQKLQEIIQRYHMQGIRVLLTICQGPNDSHLYDIQPLNDAAQSNADAVQCGNEEMKIDSSVSFLYIPPQNFARYYDLCEHAMHKVRSDIPVLLGSLDPHVGGIDFGPLQDQVSYLNQMQNAMNTSVHPGGHWDWHTQTLGLIDSWHNGYPDTSVNSLSGLFSFWADQFKVNLNSGALGKHIWVVEGTGCFKGCGIDESSNTQVAIAHVMALVTDVQTAMQYKVPFFFFSGKDFISAGYYWPIGVLDVNGHPKPVRQDLRMGDLTLSMSCGSTTVAVINQEDLLARLYAGCSLPDNYVALLYS